MKKPETFTDRKVRFESRFDDPTVFDCDDFNLLKLAQHAVVRDRSFDVFPFWRLPLWIITILFTLKRMQIKMRRRKVFQWRKTLERLAGRKYLIVDVPRKTHNAQGRDVSLYFERIVEVLGRKNCVYTLGGLRANGTIDYDLCFRDVYDLFAFKYLNADDAALLSNMRATFKRIETETRLTEEERYRLKGAIEIFWRQYRTWRKILSIINPETALVIPHYQTEFIFLALKRAKVKSIELQHGLIAKEDIFYIYPSNIERVAERALFADRLFVYGDFWKQRIDEGFEYRNHVDVCGFYPYRNKEYTQEFIDFKNEHRLGTRTVIFLTVQKGLENEFISYTRSLSDLMVKEKNDVLILVKPHPSPKLSIDALGELPNVKVVTFNLEHIMPYATIHISIYSTTLYDALLYGIKYNFALYIENQADYVESVLRSGVAKKLMPDENPLLRMTQSTIESVIEPKVFFEDFNEERFKELVTLNS